MLFKGSISQKWLSSIEGVEECVMRRESIRIKHLKNRNTQEDGVLILFTYLYKTFLILTLIKYTLENGSILLGLCNKI